MTLRNSTQGEFAYIWQIKWVTISFYEDYKNANFFFFFKRRFRSGRGPRVLKVMFHETIRNDDFLLNKALQHCFDIVSNS